jgi:hypothetical protein
MTIQPVRRWGILRIGVIAVFLGFALVGCSTSQVELPVPIPLVPTRTPLPPNMLVYDAPVTLLIKTGSILPGTTIAYNGKTEQGAAKILIAGLLAPKQTADTLDWQGMPVPNVNLKLSTRVATYDDQGVNLVGNAHIELANVAVQPGGTPGKAQMELNAPVTFTLSKNEGIPGSNLSYLGAKPEGAQFAGVEGYPYRKQLDSLQYNGRLSQKVYLKMDLRVISFDDSKAVVGGTAKIAIE